MCIPDEAKSGVQISWAMLAPDYADALSGPLAARYYGPGEEVAMALDVKVKIPKKPARTYTITYADGHDGLMVAEKMEVLEGGTIAFYTKPTDTIPFFVMSPSHYQTIKVNA
jgi:hypothetical protein